VILSAFHEAGRKKQVESAQDHDQNRVQEGRSLGQATEA
jgi:hypothetical protein